MELSIITAFEAARIQRGLREPEGTREGEAEVESGPYAIIDGRFKLLDILGEGSFGAVFLAEDRTLVRQVAVKVMALGDPEAADREGRALAATVHPHVMQIFDHGQEDDYRWLVLPHLEGPSLREWCGGKSTRQILARYLEAGAGLNATHQRGLVHRDFKPSNVRLNGEGQAVVVDFGLARDLESLVREREWEGLREGAALGGTWDYIAIERLLGKPGDERSDQFAFCVALWEALAGERPFGDERDLEARLELLSRPPAGAARIPWHLRKVLLRGLSPLPGDRWPTMTRLLGALRVRSMIARWAVSLGTLASVGLMVLGLTSALQQPAELPSFALPDLAQDSVDAVAALDTHDHPGALTALWSAYPAATSQDEKRELRILAKIVATHLEDEGASAEAFDSWWIVRRLSFDLHDKKGAARASVHVRALADEI